MLHPPCYICWGVFGLCASPSAASPLHHKRQLSNQPAKRTHSRVRTTSYLHFSLSSFFSPLTEQPEDPRLPWELAPGHSLRPRLSSSRPWWLQLTVSPVPPRSRPPPFLSLHLHSKTNFSLFISVTRACVGRLDVWLPVGGQPARFAHWLGLYVPYWFFHVEGVLRKPQITSRLQLLRQTAQLICWIEQHHRYWLFPLYTLITCAVFCDKQKAAQRHENSSVILNLQAHH